MHRQYDRATGHCKSHHTTGWCHLCLGCGSASYLHKVEKTLAGFRLGCVELSLLGKAASFDCLDDIRPKNWVEIDSLGHKNHTEPNLEAVILRGPADSGRMETDKSDHVEGMQNPAEAGNSLVEDFDLRTGPGHVGLAAVEATSYNLERSSFEDRDHSLFVERIHRADGPGLEDRWLPQVRPYEVSATL